MPENKTLFKAVKDKQNLKLYNGTEVKNQETWR